MIRMSLAPGTSSRQSKTRALMRTLLRQTGHLLTMNIRPSNMSLGRSIGFNIRHLDLTFHVLA